jgi:hypothetical protein
MPFEMRPSLAPEILQSAPFASSEVGNQGGRCFGCTRIYCTRVIVFLVGEMPLVRASPPKIGHLFIDIDPPVLLGKLRAIPN